MQDDDLMTLWVGAFRYYCGRMSYAVSDFVRLLIRTCGPLLDLFREHGLRERRSEYELGNNRRRGLEAPPPLLEGPCD